MVQPEAFFEEQTEASKLKADIVSKYFSGWANVMASQDTERIAYLDLFSGPGRYDDGNLSTPLLVLDKAINHLNPRVCQKTLLIFNDADSGNVQRLENEIREVNGLDRLRFRPSTSNQKIGKQIVKHFENITQVPTLSFVDPWGYKGLSLHLVRALVKDWGCDCIFFFNYRRINPGIENPSLQKPISIVFTEGILEELRQDISGKEPHERETIILAKLKEVFKGWGMDHVLPFPFKNETGSRTTHYLVFISKHPLGYTIMKDIMGGCSSCHRQGVPSFEYNPAASRQPQLHLFKLEPLEELKEMLVDDFAGMSLTTRDIYEKHHIDKLYVMKNYRAALLDLENERRITTNRAERKSKRGTFPPDMVVTFPRKTK